MEAELTPDGGGGVRGRWPHARGGGRCRHKMWIAERSSRCCLPQIRVGAKSWACGRASGKPWHWVAVAPLELALGCRRAARSSHWAAAAPP